MLKNGENVGKGVGIVDTRAYDFYSVINNQRYVFSLQMR